MNTPPSRTSVSDLTEAEYHDRYTGMTRPVLAYADLGNRRLSELTPAERIIAGIAWLADNSEYGIDDAAKKLIDEFRAFCEARSESPQPSRSDVLKPCPCCGGKALFGEVREPDDRDFGGHFVYCTGCDLTTALVFPLKDDVTRELAERWNKRHALSESTPIDMLLFCPNCGEQHVDEPDERTPGWTNPPHRSHLCHFCKHIWRPADVATNGVQTLKTKGKNDGNPRPRYFATAEDFNKATRGERTEST